MRERLQSIAWALLMVTVQWLPTFELMARDAYSRTQARGAREGLRHTLLGTPALVTFVLPSQTGTTETSVLLKAAEA